MPPRPSASSGRYPFRPHCPPLRGSTHPNSSPRTAPQRTKLSKLNPPGVSKSLTGSGLGALGYATGASGTHRFTVTNEGDTTGVYMLAPRCEGFASGGSCTSSPSGRVTVAPSSSATVDVSFTTAGTLGEGSIMLVVHDSVMSSVRDSIFAEVAPAAASVSQVD